LELDETLADAYAALGQVSKQYEWDWAKSERMYKRALELNPNSWLAHVWYAGLLSQIGRFDEAINLDMRARELDPVSVNSSTFLGRDLYRARRYDQAIRACQEGLELDPMTSLLFGFRRAPRSESSVARCHQETREGSEPFGWANLSGAARKRICIGRSAGQSARYPRAA